MTPPRQPVDGVAIVSGAMDTDGPGRPVVHADQSRSGAGRGRLRDAADTDLAWSVLSYLLAGMLAWGGLGWLGDWWLGADRPLLLPVGVIVGVACGVYLAVARHSRS